MSNEMFMIEACGVAGVYLVEEFTSDVFVCEDFEDFQDRLFSDSFGMTAGGPDLLIGFRCTKEQAQEVSTVFGVQSYPGGPQLDCEIHTK